MDDCDSMDCQKVKDELVFLYFDNEMGDEMVVAFRRHVSRCPHCARETEHVERLLTVVRERAHRCRCHAPGHLRTRILASMPHRRPSAR